MPSQLLQIIPWSNGLNTSQQPSLIAAGDLVEADNVIIDELNKKPRSGHDLNWDDATSGSIPLIADWDYWFEQLGIKNHKMVAWDAAGSTYAYSFAGARTDITDTTNPSGSVSAVSMLTFNNWLLMAASRETGSPSVLKIWDGSSSTIQNLTAHALWTAGDQEPPKASMLQEHFGRVYSNDLERKDRLHYTSTNNVFEWGGTGDSGAIDIGVGDGDPEGITAIFPSFRGSLFVAKKTKLYRIDGTNPATASVTLVSEGIGCEGPKAVAAVDTADVYWVSQKGIHSLVITQKFGDVEDSYLSKNIQKDFRGDIEKSLLSQAVAAYIPDIGSTAFSFATEGSSYNNAIYLINTDSKQWYTWKNVDATAMAKVTENGEFRLFLGRQDGRLTRTQTEVYYDIDASGTETSYDMTLQTGVLYPQATPYKKTRYRRFGLFYVPNDTHDITVTVRVDNYSDQSLDYDDLSSGPTLDQTFILNQSVLGSKAVAGPQTFGIDGVGRGCQVKVVQTIDHEFVELDGFFLEWAPAGSPQEFLGGLEG